MPSFLKRENIPFVFAILVCILLISVEFVDILHKNRGHFTYTLDDPYIHLALAEHIAHFHYGINSNEFSAPASSILWPFILTPFMSLSWNSWIPLLLNIIATFMTLYMVWKVLALVFERLFTDKQTNAKLVFITFLLCLLIPATNMIGLIFLGMEHAWQVLATMGVLYAIIRDLEGDYSFRLFFLFTLLGVLLRYENLTIGWVSVAYLFFSGHRRDAIIISVGLLLIIAGFSLFLMHLGLHPIPTSILIKTHHFYADKQDFLHSLMHVSTSKLLLSSCFLLLLAFCFFSKDTQKKRWLSAGVAFAILLHFIFGKFGWYDRYEIYIEIFSLVILIYFFSHRVAQFFLRSKTGFIAIAVLLELFFCQQYNHVLFTTPQAANNVYEQQYQIHRFVLEYYKKPVLVNDIGYVAYQNPYDVVDLYGLGSMVAAKHRSDPVGASPAWMNALAKKHHASLAMIYDAWFPEIPAQWIKVAELKLSAERITPAYSNVSFYVLNDAEILPIKEELLAFQKTLPMTTMLTINGEIK